MFITHWRPLSHHLAIALLLTVVLAASASWAISLAENSPPDHGTSFVLATAAAGDQVIPSPVLNDDDDDDDESSKIVSGRLVRPLGWIAALFMVSASLYYSAKRSVLVAVQAAEGTQRRLVGTELRHALDRHIVASLAAAGIALLHVLNFFGGISLTFGWLALLLMLAIAASGVFGRFLTGAPGVRRNWRRLHLPLTYSFFAILAVHVIQVIEIFGD